MLLILIQSLFLTRVAARCSGPSLAHPLPNYDADHPVLRDAFAHVKALAEISAGDPKYDPVSFSIAVTSSNETLWDHHHTARRRNESRPDIPQVTGDALYRIASITKVFTVLAILQQHEAGNLDLDEPVDKYLPELSEKQHGTIPWTNITLRSLASQLSGIPRDFAQGDLVNAQTTSPWTPKDLGLPPVSRDGLLNCDEYSPDFKIPCTREDLLRTVKGYDPVFQPNQQSMYSNVAFELLGLVVEKVTNQTYESYIEKAIFQPLGMSKTTLFKPEDSAGVIPIGPHYWDVDEGVQKPTGGIYASATDLSKFLRYILTHYNTITPSLNWMNIASSSFNLNSFYGMPWEIFQTDRILPASQRVVRFVTKGGGLPSYSSLILLLPEYDLGITILVAGPAPELLAELLELVTVQVTQAAEQYAILELEQRYAGRFVSTDPTINSSITLVANDCGLFFDSFVSNSTDVLSALRQGPGPSASPGIPKFQLIPTLQYRDQKRKNGATWRLLPVPESAGEGRRVWDDFYIADVDTQLYAGRTLNEVIMWQGEAGGAFNDIELPAYRIKLTRILTQAAGSTNGSESLEL